jgi:hypothetical protein
MLDSCLRKPDSGTPCDNFSAAIVKMMSTTTLLPANPSESVVIELKSNFKDITSLHSVTITTLLALLTVLTIREPEQADHINNHVVLSILLQFLNDRSL